MTLRLFLLPMICMSLILISAKPTAVQPKKMADEVVPVEVPAKGITVKQNKLNFIERFFLKLALKKFKKADDTTKADKQARNSFTVGIVGLSLLIVGLFVPYVILASVPAGIVAMVTGSAAIHGGTNEYSKARTGKTLGLISLIGFGLILLIAAILDAAVLSSWH